MMKKLIAKIGFGAFVALLGSFSLAHAKGATHHGSASLSQKTLPSATLQVERLYGECSGGCCGGGGGNDGGRSD
jgi:hypothetical protein